MRISKIKRSTTRSLAVKERNFFNIKIIPNYKKLWAKRLAKTVSAYLKKHGFEIVHRNPNATICIGGDGTIFYANHRNELHGAVLGIGSETSFVCTLRRDNWHHGLLRILEKPKVEKRITLTAKINNKNKIISAINDIVIHTNDYRVIRVFLDISNKHYSFDGDGVIVSTPTGSTAYAYSAGGKILDSSSRKIGIVPICSYKRKFKPSVAGANSSISIHCDRSSSLVIDGILIGKIRHGQSVKIKKGKEVVFL